MVDIRRLQNGRQAGLVHGGGGGVGLGGSYIAEAMMVVVPVAGIGRNRPVCPGVSLSSGIRPF